jgi:hypothetical protein
MESLRLNEELLLTSFKPVEELENEELEKLGIKRTKAYFYRHDERGVLHAQEAEAVKDEEFNDGVIRIGNYRVGVYLLEDEGEDINLSLIEQVGNNHDHEHLGHQCKCRRGTCKCGRGNRTRNGGRKGDKKKRGGSKWGREQRFTCGTWVYSEHCGYRYWKRVPCGRDWCPECGKPNSLHHKKRYQEILDVMLLMWLRAKFIAYMVITCTEELRELWKKPKELAKFREYIRRLFKREGLWPVLYAWHFAGDKSKRWYPHLNLIIPMGYMDKKKLERIRRLIEKRYGIKVVNYRYTRSLGKIMHWARYISRPTWNLQNEVKPDEWKHWRKWGIWGDELLNLRKKVLSEQEKEEFWMTFGALVSLWVQARRGEEIYGDIKELVRKVFEMAFKNGRGGLAGLVDAVFRDKRKSVEQKIEEILDVFLRLKGYRGVKELVPYIVSHGRCIGCFQKLKWKWKKAPFVSVDQNVYKVGYGNWIAADKEHEEDAFPF